MKIGAKKFWKYSLGYFLLNVKKIFPHREYIVYGTYSVAMYAARYERVCMYVRGKMNLIMIKPIRVN